MLGLNHPRRRLPCGVVALVGIIALWVGTATWQAMRRPSVGPNGSLVWKQVSQPELSFIISFPGVPVEQTRQLKTSHGEETAHALRLKTADGNYQFEADDYGRVDVGPSPDWFFDRFRDLERTGSSASLSVKSEKPVKIDGVVARELLWETKSGLVIRERMVLATDHFFHLAATYSPGHFDSKQVDAFFDSWRLVR